LADLLNGSPIFADLSSRHHLEHIIFRLTEQVPQPPVCILTKNSDGVTLRTIPEGVNRASKEPVLFTRSSKERTQCPSDRDMKYPFAEVFPCASDDALSLLQLMLQSNPEARCSIDTALKSRFLSSLHCPEDEPVREPLDMKDVHVKGNPSSLRADFYHAMRSSPLLRGC
jgi:serine/threonine protein kinase